MATLREIRLTVPLPLRGVGEVEVRATTIRVNGKPAWPKTGSGSQTKIFLSDGQRLSYALFVDGRPVQSHEITMRDGKVRQGSRSILPVLGMRSLTDISVIPGMRRQIFRATQWLY